MVVKKQSKILIVDDEEHVLNSLKRVLKNEPYEVFSAPNAREGLDILKKEKIDLVLVDFLMPEMDGNKFLAKVKEKYPEIQRLMLTGKAEVPDMAASINEGEVYRSLLKPWDEAELKTTLRHALAHKAAEKELLVMQNKYHLIIKSLSELVFSVDLSEGRPGKLTFAHGIEDLTGYEPKDFFNNPNLLKEMIHEEDRAIPSEMAKRLYLGKPVKPFAYRIVRKNSEIRWVRSTFLPQYDVDQKLVSFDVVIRDITKEKQSEEILKQNEEKYRSVVELSPEPMIILQEDVPKLINKRYTEVFGYTLEDLLKLDESEMFPEEERDKIMIELKEKIRMKQKQGDTRRSSMKVNILAKNGKIIPCEVAENAILYNGKYASLAILRDMSKRYKMEAALRKSEEQYRSLVENVDETIWEINTTGVFTYISPQSIKHYGLRPDDIIGMNVMELMPPDDGKKFRIRLAESLKIGGVQSSFESRFVNKDGLVSYFESNGKPFFSEEGEVLGVRGVTMNVSERKNAEKEKAALEAQLYRSEKMAAVGQLAAGVAHEINNPIGFISSNLSTLNDYEKDIKEAVEKYQALVSALKETQEAIPPAIKKQAEQTTEYASEIDLAYVIEDIDDLIKDCREGTDRVMKIVIDLKNFAHPGEQEMSLADVNHGIESTLSVIWNELKYKTTVNKDYGDLPAINCFPQQLNQVFLNILVNAAQAIEKKGEINIKTREKEGHVEIMISDTGSGISKENLSKIFDPFFTTKEVGKGTGLGMNVAYNIIKKHNGNINVKSTVGKGTTFTIQLPMDAS